MDNYYEPEHFFLYEIRVRQIIFDESADVTIFGSIPDENDYEKSISWDFLCSFALLTDILLFADDKDKGDLLIKIISEKLSAELEIPTVIDVEDIFDKELIFSNLVYEVYPLYEKDENGDMRPTNENCYFIEAIEDKDEFFKREGDNYKFKEHTTKIPTDILEAALNNLENTKTEEEQLSEYLSVLDNAFKYYLQLLSKNFSEKEARKRAGLGDELLFRIAVLNNKIINK